MKLRLAFRSVILIACAAACVGCSTSGPPVRWAACLFDISSERGASVAATRVTLFDMNEAVAGTGTGDLELRVVPDERAEGDHSRGNLAREGTSPFGGWMGPDESLWLWVAAGLDDRGASKTPARCEVALLLDGQVTLDARAVSFVVTRSPP